MCRKSYFCRLYWPCAHIITASYLYMNNGISGVKRTPDGSELKQQCFVLVDVSEFQKTKMVKL